MIETLLKKERKNKFNDWGKKEPIVCLDRSLISEAVFASNNPNLSPEEKSMIYLNILTGCKGFEFILYSNAQINNPICLGDKVIIHPCFLPIVSGMNNTDPLVEVSYNMYRKNKYIYDGWVSIENLNEENIRSSIEELRGLISLLSITSNSQCKIEAKYRVKSYHSTTHFMSDNNLNSIESLSKSLTEIQTEDKNALLRSIGWLSNGITTTDFELKFLSFMISIESLCYYIEETSKSSSCFSSLKSEKVSKNNRRKVRDECISQKIDNITESNDLDLRKEIEEIYFNCIQGSRKRLESHLSRIMTDSSIDIFIGKPSLYQIRNNIAHGSHDVISEEDKTLIINNINNINDLASKYIFRVIRDCIYDKDLNLQMNAKISASNEGIISNRDIYQGTTDISHLYANNI